MMMMTTVADNRTGEQKPEAGGACSRSQSGGADRLL